MYVCICNQITDKEIKQHLNERAGQTVDANESGVEEFYQCCSGGEPSNCGRCLDMVEDFMLQHNKSAQTVREMSDKVNKITENTPAHQEPVKTEEPV